MHEYAATARVIHDGDTLSGVDVDLGFYTWIRDTRLRLAGINAPELREPGGPEARQFVVDHLPALFVIRTVKHPADNYGNRFDAWVMLPDGACLNRLLVDAGHATPLRPYPIDPPPEVHSAG